MNQNDLITYARRRIKYDEQFHSWLEPTAQEKLELHVFDVTRSLHDMALQIFRYPS